MTSWKKTKRMVVIWDMFFQFRGGGGAFVNSTHRRRSPTWRTRQNSRWPDSPAILWRARTGNEHSTEISLSLPDQTTSHFRYIYTLHTGFCVLSTRCQRRFWMTSLIADTIYCGAVGCLFPPTERRDHGSTISRFHSNYWANWCAEGSKKHRPRALWLSTIRRYANRLLSQNNSWLFFKCYLCPGNKRAQGDANPQYESTFVFVNDYSAVKEEQAEYKQDVDPNGCSPLQLNFVKCWRR